MGVDGVEVELVMRSVKLFAEKLTTTLIPAKISRSLRAGISLPPRDASVS
jgi:hypothetical protein